MKFHNYDLMWKAYANEHWLKGSSDDLIPEIVKALKDYEKTHQAERINTSSNQMTLLTEMCWVGDRNPYYDIYPSVVRAFTKINLDKVKTDQIILPLDSLLIRFPVGHELTSSNGNKVSSVLVANTPHKDHRMILIIIQENKPWLSARGNAYPPHVIVGMSLREGEFISASVNRTHDNTTDQTVKGITVVDRERTDDIIRIICAICLLGDNPDLIEPQPIEADRMKWEATHDIALIEKAARRGKRGWSVGKHIECAPGYRNPHFGLRWTGKGRTIPRVVPIKGCLVRRNKVLEVPTGYLADEGELV